jgi:methylmalonyl-CoA epimerase
MGFVEKIEHIGIAVRSLEQSVPIYRDLLGLQYEGQEVIEREGVRAAFFKVGTSRLELLEPLGDKGAIARYLEKRGEGIHHIALRVDDIVEARKIAEKFGARLLSETPLSGAHGTLVTFIHPGDTGRVLFELVQQAGSNKSE